MTRNEFIDIRHGIDVLANEMLWGKLLLALMDATPKYMPETLKALYAASKTFSSEAGKHNESGT